LRVGFGLSGTNLASAGLRWRSVALEGLLHWPMLEVTNLTAEFDAGSKLSAGFELEIGPVRTGRAASEAGRDGALRGPAPRAAVQRLEDSAQNSGWHLRQLHWDYDGPLPVLLPESVTLKTIHGSGSAEGVWPELSHAGSVELSGIEAGPFRAATGRMSWSGRQLLMERISAQIANGASTVAVEGKGGMTPRTGGMDAHLALNTFDLVTRDGVWRLQEPVRLEMARASNTFALDLPPLELTGPDRRLAMQASVLWPSNGSGRISLQGLRSGDLDEFIAPDLPALSVPEATVAFGWNNGPLTFDVQAQAEWRKGDDSIWSVDCAARSDGDSMQFDPVRVDLNGAPAVMLTGHLPLHIEPGAGWRIGESAGSQAVQLDLQVMERGPLWAFLEEYAGVRIGSPSLTFQARGEAPNIDGHLSFSAANVALTQTNTGPARVIPQLDNPRFEARVGLKGLELRGASAELLGQPIQAEADWEVMASDWNEWLEAILACDLARLTGWVRMDDAELSALAALVPDFIAPAGTLDLDLAMRPGLRVEGHLVLTNATTRYLRPVGALRNIEADITLNGWNGTINRFSGTLGGQPVDLSGELAWRPDGDRQFDLSLTGENLPLVRDPEFFVRADLDVRLQKSFGEVARLSGGVTLQHSLLFRDFSMLVGPDLQRPDQRPPYFSIPQLPLGDWQLDLSVKGDRFLHVVSPAFKGEVSAGLRLLGTLREPFTVGTVTVDQGKILFPFGMVELENGRVELSREDPYRPRVDFRATGQNFGYTITVDLTGPVDAPNLTFQSVPPLTAQQILLMLSAGEIPRSDFSYSSTDKASKVGFYIGNEFVNRFIGNTSTSERLFFRSGEQITDDGKPTYSLEYRFTDRWSVFGEYNRFRDFNSGLKLKVLSK